MGAAPAGRSRRRHTAARPTARRADSAASKADSENKSYAGLRLGFALALLAAAIILKYSSIGALSGIKTVISENVNKSVSITEVFAAIGKAITGNNGADTVNETGASNTSGSNLDESQQSSASKTSDANSVTNGNVSDSETNGGSNSGNSATVTATPTSTVKPTVTPTVTVAPSPTTAAAATASTVSNSSASSKNSSVTKVSNSLKTSTDLSSQEKLYLTNLLNAPVDEGTDNTPDVAFIIPAPDKATYSKLSLTFKYVVPLRGEITSPFGYRDHPVDGEAKFHFGVDIGGSEGSPIYAFAKGTVDSVGYDSVDGNYIWIQHAGGIKTFYGHCSKIYVKKGASVKAGKKIAAVGSTGNATGPHLHFQIMKNGIAYNPTPFLT